MSSDPTPAFAVLNPGGRDPFVDYGSGLGAYDPGVHPPVNFHAFAAATGGAFCHSVEQVAGDSRFAACIVLLRRKMAVSLDAVKRLKAEGLKVFVSWKECGPLQVSRQLVESPIWTDYREALDASDGLISPAASPPPIPPECDVPVFDLATPYPIDLPEWISFAAPTNAREGIFVGTRELFEPARNHLAAVCEAVRVARRSGTFVTVINREKRKGRKILEEIGGRDGTLRVVEGKLPYGEYIRLMTGHRLVFHLDRGEVPGQVAGDALLCKSVCVGGNTAIEQIAFPSLSASDLDGLAADDALLAAAVERSQTIAAERLSFSAGREQLGALLR